MVLGNPQTQIKPRIQCQKGVRISAKAVTDRPRRRPYNNQKYKEVPRETAQVGPEQVVNDTNISHTNLEEVKFILDCIWRCVDSRKKEDDFISNSDNYIKIWALMTQEDENHIELVMEESLMSYNSYTSKKYKKKKIVRIMDVLIKNVSISNIDYVLWNKFREAVSCQQRFHYINGKISEQQQI
ncbi:MAG: hypothetical protein EZS28_034924 [Streblomastix strix]|uniref:Uncharacterized protein n=1 Tax=Streblomastix strix TaxID=222440 RepID=A0A5J4UG51_9EUKA|nr:MAG: hypothetical protein EZS28_034924 [Streblomastix strix]